MSLIYLRHRPRHSGYYWVFICANLHELTEPPRYIEKIVRAFSTCQDGDSPEAHTDRMPNRICWDGDEVLIEDPRLIAFAGPIEKPGPWNGL
jgi:hypothetical protein